MKQYKNSMAGKVCMVTGATSGIGIITALKLAEMGGEVVVVSRNADRCAFVVDSIRKDSGNSQVNFIAADLSSQYQIRKLALDFQENYARLDVLVNNVGGIFLRRKESIDGIEMTFALNHLSYFLLTKLLLDMLKSSTPARIVNVSSNGHYDKPLDFDDLQSKKRYWGLKAYGRSKMANVLFTYELARRLSGTGVTVNALHPGLVETNIAKDNGIFVSWIYPILKIAMIPPEDGAQTSIYLASSPEVEGVTGKFFTKCMSVKSDLASYNQESQKQLWESSKALTDIGRL